MAVGSGFLLVGKLIGDHLNFRVLAVVQGEAEAMVKFIGSLALMEQVWALRAVVVVEGSKEWAVQCFLQVLQVDWVASYFSQAGQGMESDQGLVKNQVDC